MNGMTLRPVVPQLSQRDLGIHRSWPEDAGINELPIKAETESSIGRCAALLDDHDSLSDLTLRAF